MADKLWFEEEEELAIQGVNVPSDIANDIAYASLMLQQRKQEPYMPKQPLIDAYRALGDMSPDQIAHYQKMADEYGYTMATIMNLPEVRNDIEKRGKTLTPNDYDWDSFMLSAPKMAELLAREVSRMAIVRDDLDNIKQTEEVLSKPTIPFISDRKRTKGRPAFSRSTKERKRIHERSVKSETWTPVDFGPGRTYKELATTFRHGAASTKEGILNSRYIAEREGLSPYLLLLPDIEDAWAMVKGIDIEERMLDWKRYREAVEESPYYVNWYRDKGFFGKLLHGFTEQAGRTYAWMSVGAGQATWALLAGLGASAIAGAGKMTAPVVGAAGALLSAKTTVEQQVVSRIATWAKRYGMMRAIQLSEMFGNYRDMEAERDIYGQGLDSHDMAKWSYIAASIQAPIELMQLGLALSWVPIRWFKPMYRTTGPVAAITSRVFGTPSLLGIVTRNVARGVVDMVNEVAEEFLQGSVGALTNRYLKYTSGQPFALPGFTEEFLDPLEEAKMAFYSFGLWSALGVSGSILEDKVNLDEYNQSREIFEELNDLVNESKTKERSPSTYEKNIRDIVDGTPRENVYIPVRRWQTYWQDQNVDPEEAAAGLGVEDEYRRAVDESNVLSIERDAAAEREFLEALDDDGARMAIPTEVYASKIAGTELQQGLAKDIAFSETGITEREVETTRARLESEIDAFTEDLDKRARALRDLKENIRIKLSDAGLSLEQAETVSDINARVLFTVAKYTGEDPQAILNNLTIVRDEVGEAEVKFKQDPKGGMQFDQDSGKAIIRIFKDADISTAVHEFTGHFAIEHMLRAEAMGTLSEEGLRDLAVLRDWVGVTEGEELTTEHKEQIARGFEAYLMEGKAPTPEVVTIFEKIKRWLLDIYRELSVLGVELSDEVRSVFDRWIMLEDEADAIMQRQHLDRIVELAEQAGVSTDNVETLAKLVNKSLQEQHASLVENGVKPLVNRLQNTLGDRRKQIKKEVSAMIRSQPVYQMISVLRRPKSRFSLSKQEILDVFGEEGLKVFRHMYKVKDANLSLSDAVAMFGFANIDEMYTELAAAQPIADVVRRAYQDNLNREIQSGAFGDGLREIAEKATHNDDMLASLVLESLILDARTTKQNLVEASIKRAQMMRANAKLLILRNVVSKVSPARYFAQETKYARKYEQALLDGEYEAAVYYKDLQAQNFALAREAIEVRENVKRGMQLIKKYKNRGRKTYGLPIKVLDAIANLVDSVDAKRRTKEEQVVRDELRKYIEERKALGEEIELPEEMINSLARKPIDQMTVGEFYDLIDAIKTLEHIGKLENKFLEAERQEDFDKTISGILEEIALVTQKEGKDIGALNPTLMQKLKDGLDRFVMEHNRIDFLIQILSNFNEFSKIRDAIYNPLEKATGRATLLQYEAAQKIVDIINKYYPEKESRRWHKQWLKTSLIPGQRMNKDNMLAVALNYLNVEGRERLMTGFGLDSETIETWLNENMTEADWGFVKDVLAFLESYWPEVEKLMVDVTGLRPKKVEPAGMMTPYGWIAGGYYPIAYDRRLSHLRFFTDTDMDNNIRMISGARSMIAGYAKPRLATVGEDAKLMLSVTPVLAKHVADITEDLAFKRAIRDVRRIINDPDIRHAITRALGKNAMEQFDRWLDHIQSGFAPATTSIQRMIRRARMGATMVGLGLRMSPAIAQIMGYSSAAAMIGPARVGHAIMSFYSDPSSWNEKVKFVHDRSPFMRFRRQSWDRDVAAVMKRQIQAGTMDRIRETGFYFIGFMDATVTIPVWLEAYNMKIEEGLSEQRAIEYADMVIRQTQNVGRAIDLVTKQRGSEFDQLCSMFYSFMGTLRNMTYLETQHLIKKGDVARFAAFLLWGLVIPANALIWMRQGGPEEPDPWDDEAAWWTWFKWAARNTLGYYVGTWIMLRDFFGIISGYETYQFSPALRGFTEIANVSRYMWKMFEDGDKTLPERAQDLAKATYPAAEFWWRLPTKGLRQNFAYLMDYITSDAYDKEFEWRRFLFNAPKNK
jgi:nuclear transport factor 2 (NTF2) superfamily protein